MEIWVRQSFHTFESLGCHPHPTPLFMGGYTLVPAHHGLLITKSMIYLDLLAYVPLLLHVHIRITVIMLNRMLLNNKEYTIVIHRLASIGQ